MVRTERTDSRSKHEYKETKGFEKREQNDLDITCDVLHTRYIHEQYKL